MEGCCWLEEIFMTHSGHKTWVRALVETKQKHKKKVESINQCEFTVTADTLTFVTCIIGLLGRIMTPGDIAEPALIPVFKNVQNPHKIRALWPKAVFPFKNSLILCCKLQLVSLYVFYRVSTNPMEGHKQCELPVSGAALTLSYWDINQ